MPKVGVVLTTVFLPGLADHPSRHTVGGSFGMIDSVG
jgi:hypothetical protein